MVPLTVTQSDIIHCDEANDRTPGKENAHLVSLHRIPKYPSAAKHLSFKGYLYTWPEKKSNTLWREGDRKERKRGGKGRGLLSEPQMPPSAHFNKPKGCVLGIPRGGGGTTALHFFLLPRSCVPCSTDPALPSGKRRPWVLQRAACSALAIGRWKEHRRTAQGGSRQETGGLQSTFSRASEQHVTGESAPHPVTRCSKNKPLKTGAHKTQTVCGVKDTKKSQVFMLKQMYEVNSVPPRVMVQFLQCSGCQTHKDQKHVSNSVKKGKKSPLLIPPKRGKKKKPPHTRNSLSLLLSARGSVH